MADMGVSVLVVDDHSGFRAETRALLEADGYRVVGEASDGAEALAQSHRLRPDVILLDIGLPDRSGLDMVEALRAQSPGTLVVLVSGRRETEYGDRVAASGADAFMEKRSLFPGAIPALLSDIGRR